jgi:hypothetical protein
MKHENGYTVPHVCSLRAKRKKHVEMQGVLDDKFRQACGCETWSLALWDEHRLRVFENRVPRKIFGPKRDEVTGEWRRLHNEELNDLY